MHLAARVFALAILPSIAFAQTEARSPSPATSQATSSLGLIGSVGAESARPDSTPRETTPARVLVLDCPASANAPSIRTTLDRERADSLGTSGLVALLCARAGATTVDLPSAAVAHASHSATRPAGAEHHSGSGAEPSEPATPLEPQLRVHLFADIKYSATDSVGSKNGFGLGQFDLFARSQISDRLSVLTEATLTALPRNTFNAKLERILLTFSPSDRFNASVGRFHTGIGYYNAAYHHGAWFQTAVGRPLVFSIDGDIGIVPIHTLGVSTTGEIPSGALGLRYIAELGSGRAGQSSAAISPQPGLNDNNSLSLNVGLIARPERFDGLQFGVSVYRDRLTLADTTKAPLSETIAAAHALYKTDAVELLAEALTLRHHSLSGTATNDMRGYYAQASRRFRAVRPYVRVDYVDVPRSDQLFGFLGRRSGPTAGVRYDFDALAALKLQASHLNQTTRPTMNRLDAQVSFMF
ncbi:MAG TPA: hypothetical protein VGP25_15565 [Gemmatimonadaceae bacterium]|nr:hypothetical protein [Gemmatimonadaceae bacterium]